jgi:putative aldouronate transport system permease protein
MFVTGMKKRFSKVYKYRYFYIMLIPVVIFYVLFHYLPMYGIRMAFYDFGIFGDTKFIGTENFERLFESKDFIISIKNTLILSGYNLFIGLVITLVFALLLNEFNEGIFKKFIQTTVYLPHFLSWVVIASIFTLLLSPEYGAVNALLSKLGIEKTYFLISEKWWRPIFIAINRWKETGWAAIIYLAALSNVDPQLYEAASMDGAGRLKQVLYITIPSIMTTILTVLILDMARVLNIFMPVFVLQNTLVYDVSDVIETYTYRTGILNGDYDYATAVGLFKSIIALLLVIIANKVSKRIKGESIL